MSLTNLLLAFVSEVGFILGLIVALLCIMAWMGLADAAREWLIETFLDSRSKDRRDFDIVDGGEQDVLVSDIHIDTWDMDEDGDLGPRGRPFVEMIETLQAAKEVRGFVLNGDLMDVPVFAGDFAPGSEDMLFPIRGPRPPNLGLIAERYDPVLRLLGALRVSEASDGRIKGLSRAIFQTGNHDMGMQGIRLVRGADPSLNVAWNPQILLNCSPSGECDGRSAVYIEHGHFYDPFLWLYARYSLLDITRGGELQRDASLVNGMQKGGRRGMGRHSKPGSAITEAEAAHLLASRPAQTTGTHWDFEGTKRPLADTIVVYRFRYAARKCFHALHRGVNPGTGHPTSGDAMQVRTVTFGHTHIPDRYVFPGGHVYVNSGDWCGNTPHRCYCIVQSDGAMLGPFQWWSRAVAVERHRWTLGEDPSASLGGTAAAS